MNGLGKPLDRNIFFGGNIRIMKVKKTGDTYQIRVEELLPCSKFFCAHELMSCATQVWCPDGCFDTNNYHSFCIPKCIDCVHYQRDCNKWASYPDREQHSAMSRKV